jgi:cytochrome b561
MTRRPGYGTTAKLLHWLIVALLVVQYLIGWFMPDIHGGMDPGTPMFAHVSIGMTILVLIVLRLVWRLTHPVAPESSLPRWQRLGGEAVHWALYVLVFLTTVSGWLFVTARGWLVQLYSVVPLPLLGAKDAVLVSLDARGHWHQVFEYALLAFIGVHVAAALVHALVYRDGVMRRMLRA